MIAHQIKKIRDEFTNTRFPWRRAAGAHMSVQEQCLNNERKKSRLDSESEYRLGRFHRVTDEY